MAFLDENYLLRGDESKKLYAAVKDLPIIDAHNHCDVKALAEDRNFTDLWEAEAATDHYVWEVLRKSGVPEYLLTGKDASNHDKWIAMAAAFEKVAGNPTYEWIHLDLKRRLGIDELITADNAEIIWQKSKAILAKKELLGKVDGLLGGRAAEEVIFGKDEITTGASNDISRATDIIKRMITDYGMSEKFKNMTLGKSGRGYGGMAEPELVREFSEETQKYVDNEIARIMDERYSAAVKLLKSKRGLLEVIAKRLLDIETMEGKEFLDIIEAQKAKAKKAAADK